MAYKRISPIPIAEGGTNTSTFTNTDGVIYYDGSKLNSTTVGTAGQLLTSNGAGVAPTFQTGAASTITITGDTGGALTSGNFTFTGGTTGLSFDGSGTTETLTITNLNLPTTTSTQGQVTIATSRFLHCGSSTTNTFVGKGAGNFTLSGTTNIGIGNAPLTSLTSGTDNIGIGSTALGAVSSGTSNISIGSGSSPVISTGTNNVGVGPGNVLNSVTTGSFNLALGSGAGSLLAAANSSNILIGNTGSVSGDNNTIRIGTQGTGNAQQNKCFIAGIDGVNVGSVATVVTEASGQLGTATVTAGSGITVTPGANTITIAATSTGFTWSVITANQTAAVNNGYICNKAGTLALALPATSAVGDIIEVTGINTATGWQITQASGQQIFFGTSSTTLGATGTLTSSAIRDAIRIVCITANTTWQVLSAIGNITVV